MLCPIVYAHPSSCMNWLTLAHCYKGYLSDFGQEKNEKALWHAVLINHWRHHFALSNKPDIDTTHFESNVSSILLGLCSKQVMPYSRLQEYCFHTALHLSAPLIGAHHSLYRWLWGPPDLDSKAREASEHVGMLINWHAWPRNYVLASTNNSHVKERRHNLATQIMRKSVNLKSDSLHHDVACTADPPLKLLSLAFVKLIPPCIHASNGCIAWVPSPHCRQRPMRCLHWNIYFSLPWRDLLKHRKQIGSQHSASAQKKEK